MARGAGIREGQKEGRRKDTKNRKFPMNAARENREVGRYQDRYTCLALPCNMVTTPYEKTTVHPFSTFLIAVGKNI